MNDLIERANKFAISAGRTGEGQYCAARKHEVISQILSYVSSILSAVVGTSIFTDSVKNHPILFGTLALTAAALTALQQSAKLGERAESHRGAGAMYGRLRRQADALKLRLSAGDLSRQDGLIQLDAVAAALSDLALKTHVLADNTYNKAKKKFDGDHPEYWPDRPTHAGGVVVRKGANGMEYLLVKSKNAKHWVLPKGHIERGNGAVANSGEKSKIESPEEAARREVLEESGVEGAIRNSLSTIEFKVNGELVRARFFLMNVVNEGPSQEKRERKWLSFEDAMLTLDFDENRAVLCQAHAALWHAPERHN